MSRIDDHSNIVIGQIRDQSGSSAEASNSNNPGGQPGLAHSAGER